MGTENRRKYDSDFKKNAVLLSIQSGKSIKGIADNLGISKDLIYQWRKKMIQKGELAFPGNGVQALTSDQQKVQDLEKQLKDALMERDILKKAMAIFSRTQ